MNWSPKVTLVLSPHTDDGEFGAGATIAKLVNSGCQVHVAAFSTAQQSVREGLPRDVLSKEVVSATKELGIPAENLKVFDFPVRHFPRLRQEILEELVVLRKEIEPDLVLVHSLSDIHQDHHTVSMEARRAFKSSTILGYELPWNTSNFSWQAAVEISDWELDQKIRTISHYRSQNHRSYANEEFIRGWARMRGVAANVTFAEVFEVIQWRMFK